jgi:thiamine biosynthesis lipoprotein
VTGAAVADRGPRRARSPVPSATRAITLAATRTAILAATLLAGGCRADTAVVHTHRFQAFATPVSIQVAGTDEAVALAAGRRIEAFMTGVEDDWYAYGPGELAAVNGALARGEAVTLSTDLEPLVRRALELHRATGGRFDPSVGDLVALWGFDRAENLAARSAPPADSDIADLLRNRGGMGDLRLEGRILSSTRPVQLDLNGLAKGTAAARAAAMLAEAGIRNALVDLGGSSMVALGTRGDRPWRIGIRHPRKAPGDDGPGPPVVARLELHPGESVSTSGDYERYLEAGGQRYGHVLDPRTGRPATGTAAATVITEDPELAEAASTALMVAGPGEMDELCRGLGIELALVITTTGELRATPAMARRLAGSTGGRDDHPGR